MLELITDMRYWFHCRLNYPPMPREKWEKYLSSPWKSFFNYGFPPYCILFQVSAFWKQLWEAIFHSVDRSQEDNMQAQDYIVDWKVGQADEVELISVPTFKNCKFVVEKRGTIKFCVLAENTNGTSQSICVVETTCSYMNHALAITIAEALRLYYERLNSA